MNATSCPNYHWPTDAERLARMPESRDCYGEDLRPIILDRQRRAIAKKYARLQRYERRMGRRV